MTPKGEEQPVVSTRVPHGVKKILEELAEAKEVNLSEYLRWTLIEIAHRRKKRK